MSEDVPLHNGPTIVVTTDDGTPFSCTPFEVGGVSHPRQMRWKLVDARALEYVGPPYARGSLPADVQRLVSEWWDGKKRLGQAGVNAAKLRNWLVEGR